MKIYKSYGVLAHEKFPFYATRRASDIYDIVEIPDIDKFIAGYNYMDQPLLQLPGSKSVYPVDDVLTNIKDYPCLSYIDDQQNRVTIRLNICD